VWDAHTTAHAAGVVADRRDVSTDVAQTLGLVAAGALALVSGYWAEGEPGLTWRRIEGADLWLVHLLLTRAGAAPEVHLAALGRGVPSTSTGGYGRHCARPAQA
jgi:hypothetical protein